MVEEAEPQHVDQQPGHADPKDHQRLLHLVRLDEALDGLQQDGEAEAGQEDGVHQSPHHLGSDPAERVLLGGVGPPGEALGHQRHHQRQHVRQHVEGVGEHRQRRGHPAHHHLQHHEHEGHLKTGSKFSSHAWKFNLEIKALLSIQKHSLKASVNILGAVLCNINTRNC
uniref:Uncharacterized protein n=1 Tax=Theropithecus gelada TaxID=9565 RepID=A0A8D2ETP3_THEGE